MLKDCVEPDLDYWTARSRVGELTYNVFTSSYLKTKLSFGMAIYVW